MGEHRLRIDYLIHIFALAHALVVVLSRTFNYFDDVPLTLLTILMIAIIAIRRNLQVEVIAALALLGCFIGYGLGVYGAKLIDSIIGDGTAAPTITTMLVTELLDPALADAKGTPVVYACGPTPMLMALGKMCVERGVRCYLSLDQHMCCGVGACFACVVKMKDESSPDGWRYSRTCKEGPVYLAEEVYYA